MAAAVAAAGLHPDTDTDPRELEAFAERFKQRRIKLGSYFDDNHWKNKSKKRRKTKKNEKNILTFSINDTRLIHF